MNSESNRRGRPTVERMLALVDRLDQAAVTVIGDAVLDRFEIGVISRVSREAPKMSRGGPEEGPAGLPGPTSRALSESGWEDSPRPRKPSGPDSRPRP